MAIFPQGLTNIDRRCDNAGERAVLHQLKRCLSDDYMVWHNVPIGPKARQPDFVILSPRRGLLILEVKHWAWSTLRSFNPQTVELNLESGPKTTYHPLYQARGYAMELNNVLESDPALQQEQDPFKGKSRVPYGWGCVLSNIRHKQIESLDFAEVFPEPKTLLRDDLAEDVDPEVFEELLWGMYAGWSAQPLTLPQRDRVRWHLFPEVRVQQGTLFNKERTVSKRQYRLRPELQITRTIGKSVESPSQCHFTQAKPWSTKNTSRDMLRMKPSLDCSTLVSLSTSTAMRPITRHGEPFCWRDSHLTMQSMKCNAALRLKLSSLQSKSTSHRFTRNCGYLVMAPPVTTMFGIVSMRYDPPQPKKLRNPPFLVLLIHWYRPFEPSARGTRRYHRTAPFKG